MANPHHPNCVQLRNRFSGYIADDVAEFVAAYGIQLPALRIRCAGCCLAYLVHNRQYNVQINPHYSHVVFVGGNAAFDANVAASVRPSASRNGVHGQIATANDFNLGQPGKKLTQLSHTYQTYANQGPVALGVARACILFSILRYVHCIGVIDIV
jgi:hypothetical protein